jgi:hypothetical protein
LAGKIETNPKSGDKLWSQMVQVETVMKMLDPDFDARAISAKRRNVGNPWFKRGTMFRSAVDVMRRAGTPMTGNYGCPDSRKGPAGYPKAGHRFAGVHESIFANCRCHSGPFISRTRRRL